MSGFTYTQKSRPYAAHGESGFGETLVVEPRPTAQAIFCHGINDILHTTSSNGVGASVSSQAGVMSLHSGQSSSGSANCELRHAVKYRPGGASVGRFTSIFGTPTEGTLQIVGLGNNVSGHYFAYTGSNFGILHETGGLREIRELSLTTGVASTTNVTVTLDDDVIVVPIAGGSNTDQTAAQIAAQDYSQVGDGWKAEAHSSSVYFISDRSASKAGSYSASGGTLAGSFTQLAAGQSSQITFVSQSQWNIDKLDGLGRSGMTLDPHVGNVYQIQFQYLGFGNAHFSVENLETGHLSLCHMIKHTNSRTTTVLSDPQVRCRWEVRNTSSVVGTHISGASGATFSEGPIRRNIGIAFATASSQTSVTSPVPILSLRCDRVAYNKGVYGEIDISTLSVAAVIGGAPTRAARIFVYKNLDLTGPTSWIPIDANRSITSSDISSTGYSLGDGYLLSSFLVTNGQTVIRKITDENYSIGIGETLTIVAEASESASIDVSATWFEDQ